MLSSLVCIVISRRHLHGRLCLVSMWVVYILYSGYSRGRVLLVPVFVGIVGRPCVLAVRCHLHRELCLVLASLLTAIRSPAHIVTLRQMILHYVSNWLITVYSYSARGNHPHGSLANTDHNRPAVSSTQHRHSRPPNAPSQILKGKGFPRSRKG